MKRLNHNTNAKYLNLLLTFSCSASMTLGSAQAVDVQVINAGEMSKNIDKATDATTPKSPEAWRKNAPKLPAPREFKMATAVRYKLNNGLTVNLVQDHRFPFVSASIGIKAGSCFESKEKLGLADMTADMLTEGTTSKKSKEIADEIDFIGGGMKASSDYDFSLLSGSALSKYSDRLFDLMSDVLLHPNFPEDELKLKKTNLLQELVMKRQEPDFLNEERFSKVVFGNHPYGVVAPTPKTVASLTRQDLVDFHAHYFIPNESVLVVVGDFDEAKMKDVIKSHFDSEWKEGKLPALSLPETPKQTGRHIFLVDRPDSVQSSVRLGNLSIKKTDADYFPTVVANEILGGASQARLFLNIREQKGYTYGAYSAITARKQPGSFSAEAEVRTDVTGPSLEEFIYELDRIRNVKVSDKELKDAKSYTVGSFQLGLETQSGFAQRLLEENLYDLPANYLETYTDKIMAVTADDVRRVARKMIDFDNIVISVVGDAKKIKPELDYFGPVEVYDTSGALSTEASKAKSTTGS